MCVRVCLCLFPCISQSFNTQNQQWLSKLLICEAYLFVIGKMIHVVDAPRLWTITVIIVIIVGEYDRFDRTASEISCGSRLCPSFSCRLKALGFPVSQTWDLICDLLTATANRIRGAVWENEYCASTPGRNPCPSLEREMWCARRISR